MCQVLRKTREVDLEVDAGVDGRRTSPFQSIRCKSITSQKPYELGKFSKEEKKVFGGLELVAIHP